MLNVGNGNLRKESEDNQNLAEDNSNENIFKKKTPDVFNKKSVHKYFAKFIGKHLCKASF